MVIESYQDLQVWQKAIALSVDIYRLTSQFPKEELYGITSQLRRASVSIVSNIAEGHSRDSTREFLHFISIAIGSLAEAETQLILAEKLGYMDNSSLKKIFSGTQELGRMLRGLQLALKRKLSPNLKTLVPNP